MAARVWEGNTDLRRLLVPVGELRRHPSNPRRGDMDAIRASLRRFGQQRPVLALPDGTIVAGNHTFQGCVDEGWSHVAVVRSDLTDAEVDAYLAADNRTGDLGTYDDEVLARLLRPLYETDRLLGTGYDDGFVKRLLAEPGGAGDDEAPVVPTRPKSEPGEVYELGAHRLMCGDATAADQMASLMDGRLADVVFIDPPYAIYGSSSGMSASITDDKIVRPFFRDALAAAQTHTPFFAPVFVCCDWRSWPSWWEVAKLTAVEPKNLIVWDKGGIGLGNNFANTYELIGYFLHMPEQKVMTGRKAGIRPISKPNVIRANRVPSNEREHNAAKPVDLIGEILGVSSKRDDLVLDFFAGSGSTLIAAEASGRRCAAMEIDPGYCDVIRQRYADYVGDQTFAP